MTDIRTFDPDVEWMDHVRPVGLVVAPNVLKRMEAIPERQTQTDSSAVAALQREAEGGVLSDTWGFFTQVLGWEPRFVAGAPGGPAMPQELARHYPEYDTTLTPDWAVAEPDAPGTWQLLVRLEAPGVEPDKRAALEGWEATPQQRFERLLRDTGVFAGVLVTDHELRLVYAPRGETSGWLAFPLRELSTVSGRVMLGGLKVVLGRARLFTEQTARRLPALLKQSREAQAEVSTKLAGQVLGALYELLRGLTVADGPRIAALAKDQPDHLYEGLLTVLMRLVFALYAEDRDLIPSHTDPKARDFYAANYGVRGLYGQLAEDDALHPDTMDERYGAWGRLLALFRLIYGGEKSGFVQARRGKLFDPDAFPFLEGRTSVEDAPRVLKVSDGCIFRILDGLTTIDGENARERLSYRSLDVEQIGSVYETIMGFEAALTTVPSIAIKAGKNNRTPVFVELETLFKKTGKNRIKELKETTGRTLSAGKASAVEAAASVEDLKTALESIVDERASPKKRASPAGTPILQPTDERRRTGSHYTPRSLTAPIVKHALEPAFERIGPDATPEQVLDLKVCDPAMGSGAFLVEAGRALGERLVAAWARWPDKRPAIPADEDEDLHARRVVAQRCLYGVDKNERAVDLARLSLWLATLARDHEFTFLDHALKCGDSLVGLTKDHFQRSARLGAQRHDQHADKGQRRADDHARVDMVVGQPHAKADRRQRRHQRQRRQQVRLIFPDQPVIGRMADHRDDQRREQQCGHKSPPGGGGALPLIGLEQGRGHGQRRERDQPHPGLKAQRRDAVGPLHQHRAQRPGKGGGDDEPEPRAQLHALGLPHHQHHAGQRQRDAEAPPPVDALAQHQDAQQRRERHADLDHHRHGGRAGGLQPQEQQREIARAHQNGDGDNPRRRFRHRQQPRQRHRRHHGEPDRRKEQRRHAPMPDHDLRQHVRIAPHEADQGEDQEVPKTHGVGAGE